MDSRTEWIRCGWVKVYYKRQHWPEQKESQGGDGSSTNIIVDITDSHVQQLPNGLVVAGATVRHRERIHAGATEDRVLVRAQGRDQRVGFLEPPVHRERDAHGQPAEDFLVLRFLRVLQTRIIMSQQSHQPNQNCQNRMFNTHKKSLYI